MKIVTKLVTKKRLQFVSRLLTKKANESLTELRVREKGHQVVDQLEMLKLSGRVPWGQHIDVVSI